MSTATTTTGTGRRITEAVGTAFSTMSADRARDPHSLSLSGLGRCTRKAAYQLAGTPVSDVFTPGQQRAANLGTMIHDLLVPRIAQVLGGRFEQKVSLRGGGLVLDGRYDVWDPEFGEVTDVKTVGENRLSSVRRYGAFKEHRIQGWGYGLALHQAGEQVNRVNILYLDRSRGDQELVQLPFSRATALKVLDRVAELKYHAGEPDNAPRDPDGRTRRIGPGWSFECNDCPFLRRCWGPDAKPHQREISAHLPVGAEEVEAVCKALVDARERETEAAKDVEWFRSRLRRARPGEYGPYALKKTPGYARTDQAAMKARLEEHGLEVPMMTTAAGVSVSVIRTTVVKTVKPKQGNAKGVAGDAAG